MQMRKALATTALTAGLALGGAPLLASPAWAVSTATPGLLGLFGYKKYQDLRANRSSKDGPIGGVDTDDSGSRRV